MTSNSISSALIILFTCLSFTACDTNLILNSFVTQNKMSVCGKSFLVIICVYIFTHSLMSTTFWNIHKIQQYFGFDRVLNIFLSISIIPFTIYFQCSQFYNWYYWDEKFILEHKSSIPPHHILFLDFSQSTFYHLFLISSFFTMQFLVWETLMEMREFWKITVSLIIFQFLFSKIGLSVLTTFLSQSLF